MTRDYHYGRIRILQMIALVPMSFPFDSGKVSYFLHGELIKVFTKFSGLELTENGVQKWKTIIICFMRYLNNLSVTIQTIKQYKLLCTR